MRNAKLVSQDALMEKKQREATERSMNAQRTASLSVFFEAKLSSVLLGWSVFRLRVGQAFPPWQRSCPALGDWTLRSRVAGKKTP